MTRVMNRKKLDLPPVDPTKVTAFIDKWKNTQGQGAELADFQSFARDLCDALNLPHPDPKSDTQKGAAYIFERPVDSYDAEGQLKQGKNRIDLYRRDCFVMEGKQTGKKLSSHGWNTAMKKAFHQAENYVRTLPSEEGRPPFIVVVDVGRSIQLYSEFSCSGGLYQHYPNTGNFTIALADIAEPEIQQRLQTLWLYPQALDESKYAAEVTREVSTTLAELAKSLEQAGFEVERTAHFLKRCLFTMFSEDVDLIPEGSFTALLEDLKDTPEHFVDSMISLWSAMNTGGFEGQLRTKLRKFNGGLFTGIDPIPLNPDQIQLLIDAAKADWRYVEPAIFGTLLERALDPRERHKLGAHYTPRAYVERLVMPTLIEPLREQWNTVQVEVEIILQSEAKNSEVKALTALREFHLHLCNIKVLDPACGSGNFLYVALEHLKRLEGEVLNSIRDLSAGQTMMETEGLTVDPHQFLGIEINPRAAAIAEIVLWIGYLQWHYRIHGVLDLPEPILRDFKNIENRDALIEYDSKTELLDEEGKPVTIWDGISYKTSAATVELIPDDSQRTSVFTYANPRKAHWPEADYIVGNPPFIGASTMRRALGDGYVDAVRNTFKGVVPESADFVMYWWHNAAELIRHQSYPAQRFGFITTNSLKQTFNRRVLEPHLNDTKNPLSLIFSVPDHPWVDGNDGAAVRISMTAAASGEKDGVLLKSVDETAVDSDAVKVEFNRQKGKVFANLKIGADINSAKLLSSNLKISNKGFEPGNDGFVITSEETLRFDSKLKEAGIIRPYINGRDLIGVSRNMWLIDCHGHSKEKVVTHFPEIYQWLSETVKPQREQNRDKKLRDNWWLHRRSRADLRLALEDVKSYITTVETSKHRFFTLLDKSIAPSNLLLNIAVSCPSYLGVLSSRLHFRWANANGSSLGVYIGDIRYNKTRCFETFPFPELSEQQKSIIGNLAEKIDKHRKQKQEQHPKLTLTNIYNVLEKLRKDAVLDKKEQLINQQGLVSILRELHDDLDRAVFEAYGWQDLADQLVGSPGATTPYPEKSEAQEEAEEELLKRLVALNHERAAEEEAGKIRWLRPDYQNPESEQDETPQREDIELTNNLITAEQAPNKSKAASKQAWPKILSEQVEAVVALLGSPATDQEIAESFKRKPLKQVKSVLEALETLGQVQCIKCKWSKI